jgi:hypothetical protein
MFGPLRLDYFITRRTSKIATTAASMPNVRENILEQVGNERSLHYERPFKPSS